MATPGGFDPLATPFPVSDELAGAPSGAAWLPGEPPPWLAAPAPIPVDPGPTAIPATAPPLAQPDMGGPPPLTDELAGGPPPPPSAAPAAPLPDAITGAGGEPASPDAFAGLAAPASAGPTPLPDAITGGNLGTTPTLTPDQHYAQTVGGIHSTDDLVDASGNFKIADDGELQRYLNDLATRNPAAFAETVTKLNDIKNTHFLAEQKRIANESYEKQRTNATRMQEATKTAQAKTDALLADAQRLADTKIDPAGGVHGAKLVAGVIASLIGGLYQARHGGSNMGLDALNSAIDKGIESQKAQLASQRDALGLRKSALAEEMARHGDAYQAAETVRLAALKHADDLLAIEQQNYNPRGTTALRIAGTRAGIAAQQQKATQEYNQKKFDDDLKFQDASRQQQIADETALHNRQTVGLGYANLANEAANRKETRDQRESDKETERQIRADEKATERADKEAERDRQFSLGGTPHLQVSPDGKPAIGPDGKPVVSYDDLRNADGTRWHSPSPEVHAKLLDKKTAATQLVKLYDRALQLRDRVGGESSVFNSDERQELDGIQAEIQILKKQGTQGMSSDQDFEVLAQSGGAKDIASFRSKAAGLRGARARTIDKFRQEMRDARYTGPDIEFPSSTPTENTGAENRTKTILDNTGTTTLNDEIKANVGKATAKRGYGIDLTNPEDAALFRQISEDTRANFDPDSTTDQRAEISRLGKLGLSKGTDAKKAIEELTQVAKSSESLRLRQLAQAELDAITPRPTPRGPQTPAFVVPDELRLLPPSVTGNEPQ